MDSNSVNEIDCIQNCIDSGNNPNWIFPGIASLSTLDVSSITTTAATLNGYIDETGGADLTQIGFEYGTTTSYGATTTETGLFIDGAFSDDLTGLTSSTTYHYRAYGINSAGIAYSSDASFTTSAIPPAPTPTPTPTPSSGGGGGASISSRIKNLVSTGNLPLAQQLVNQYPGAMTDCPVGLVCVKNAVAPTNPAASNKPTSVVSFTRSLTTGSSGTDVKNLQIYLNSKGYIIAPTGLGSKGKETTLFGALTRQALIKFQKDHKISPAAGFFGPLTRKFVANNP
jgi:hypothetical protein